jgi:rubrerythrin
MPMLQIADASEVMWVCLMCGETWTADEPEECDERERAALKMAEDLDELLG